MSSTNISPENRRGKKMEFKMMERKAMIVYLAFTWDEPMFEIDWCWEDFYKEHERYYENLHQTTIRIGKCYTTEGLIDIIEDLELAVSRAKKDVFMSCIRDLRQYTGMDVIPF